MERWVWVLVVLIIVAGSPKYVMASDSLEVNIDESLQKYVTVEANDVPSYIKGLKIRPSFSLHGCDPYLKIAFEPQGYYYDLPDEIQLPDGSRYKPKIVEEIYPSTHQIAVDFLYPGEWVIYYNKYGITIRVHVPDLKVNIEPDNRYKKLDIKVIHPIFIKFLKDHIYVDDYYCWIERSLKIILKDPQGKIVVSKSLDDLDLFYKREQLYNKINTPGEWKLIVYGWSYGYESEGWYGYKKKEPPKHAEISVKAYVNPVIKESPSEIESIVKEAKDTFTIHVANVEDESKGDIFIKAPCDKFEAKLYDPNGVLYDSTKISSSCTATFKVPDRERSGYWRIVVSSIDNPDFSNHMEFYVAPERQRIVNVQATGICGPGIFALLPLLSIGILRKRRR